MEVSCTELYPSISIPMSNLNPIEINNSPLDGNTYRIWKPSALCKNDNLTVSGAATYHQWMN
jgi:hypothetical protein